MMFWSVIAFIGVIVAVIIIAVIALVAVYGPNVIRTYFAKKGWFWAFIGEMTAVIVERFGEFHRCFISVSGERYEEFKRWADNRNLQYLKDKGVLSDEDQNLKKEEILARYKNHLPYIVLRHEGRNRDKPVWIGLPWEVRIRVISEVEEGQEELKPIEHGYAVSLDLAQRSIFVPKQEAIPQKPPFYMPDVPSQDGVNTKMSFTIIMRPHDPYKAVYGLRAWKLTLLNEIVPHIREAIANSSWYAIAQQLASEDDGSKLKDHVYTSIQQSINDKVRVNLGLVKIDADGKTVAAWNVEDITLEGGKKKRIDRYPDDNPLTLSRVYHQYGLYVVDVKIQDVEVDKTFNDKIEAITQNKFAARARIEEAKGVAEAAVREGKGRASAIRANRLAEVAGIAAAKKLGVDPTEAARLNTKIRVSENVNELNVFEGADTPLGGVAAAGKAFVEGGKELSKSPRRREPETPATPTNPSSPSTGGNETTEGGENP